MGVIVRRFLPLIILLFFVALSVLLIVNRSESKQKSAETYVQVLEVVKVKKQNTHLFIHSYGVVEPKNKVILLTEIKGVIVNVDDNFAVGKFVNKGDVLATIDNDLYTVELNKAKASLAKAQASLKEEIARGVVAKEILRNLPRNTKTELGLRTPQRLREEANVKYAEAALAKAQRDLDKTVIEAPFTGLITVKNVHIGSYVKLSTQLGEIYGTETAVVRLPVIPKSISYLDFSSKPNQKIVLVTEQKKQWQAKLVRTEGLIDSDTQMVYLIAEIDDPYQLNLAINPPNNLISHSSFEPRVLKFGMFVSTQIKGIKLNNIIKLPRYVVRNSEVVVVGKQGKIATRKVTITKVDKKHVYITDGLEDGELVALSRPDNLIDGTYVKTVISNVDSEGHEMLSLRE